MLVEYSDPLYPLIGEIKWIFEAIGRIGDGEGLLLQISHSPLPE